MQIIREPQRDGRRPYTSIAKTVGLSEAAVRQRVQRLLDAGVMQIVAVTDPLQVGFHRQAMVGIKVDEPDQIGPAWDRALNADKPVVIEAITDPEVPPLPPHITFEQARKFMTSLLHDPSRSAMIKDAMKQMLAAVKK